MQLADALAVLKEIEECAKTEGLDMGLRMAWINNRAAEVQAAATGDAAMAVGDYGSALEDFDLATYHKTQCNALSALMRMQRRANVTPIIIGGEVAAQEPAADADGIDYNDLIGKAVWHRPADGGSTNG